MSGSDCSEMSVPTLRRIVAARRRKLRSRVRALARSAIAASTQRWRAMRAKSLVWLRART